MIHHLKEAGVFIRTESLMQVEPPKVETHERGFPVLVLRYYLNGCDRGFIIQYDKWKRSSETPLTYEQYAEFFRDTFVPLMSTWSGHHFGSKAQEFFEMFGKAR